MLPCKEVLVRLTPTFSSFTSAECLDLSYFLQRVSTSSQPMRPPTVFPANMPPPENSLPAIHSRGAGCNEPHFVSSHVPCSALGGTQATNTPLRVSQIRGPWIRPKCLLEAESLGGNASDDGPSVHVKYTATRDEKPVPGKNGGLQYPCLRQMRILSLVCCS
jgi:hypothetical protein